jgi:tartrate-resistant acid phosphatase type 5
VLVVARLLAVLTPASTVRRAGDNFYPNGLNTTDDALFQQSFMDVYTAPGLQVPWHAVLGNHDYGDGYEYCEWDADKEHCTRSPMHQVSRAAGTNHWFTYARVREPLVHMPQRFSTTGLLYQRRCSV